MQSGWIRKKQPHLAGGVIGEYYEKIKLLPDGASSADIPILLVRTADFLSFGK